MLPCVLLSYEKKIVTEYIKVRPLLYAYPPLDRSIAYIFQFMKKYNFQEVLPQCINIRLVFFSSGNDIVPVETISYIRRTGEVQHRGFPFAFL